MDVVAAGVHETVSGGEKRARLLLDGQGVELGPHRDGLPRRPYPGNQARLEHALHAPPAEGLPDEAGGEVFLVARLGGRMQTLAQPDGVRELAL